MANITVTYSFTNGTTADAGEVNTNFTDIINGTSDGTKDFSISALTCAGTATFNGAVNLGNATSDDITFTGYIASSLIPKTSAASDLGSSTLNWQALYLDNDSTDGGAIYFDAGTTEYLKSSADGTNLEIGGFTTTTFNGLMGIYSNDATVNTIQTNYGLKIYNTDSSYFGRISPYQGASADDVGLVFYGTVASSQIRSFTIDPDTADFVIGVPTKTSALSGADGRTIDSANGIMISSRSSTSSRDHTFFFNPNGEVGSISTSGSSTSYNTSSDYRLKENVVSISDAKDRVMKLKPCRFNFIKDKNETIDGFIAHEVMDIIPNAVKGEKDGENMQSIDHSKMVPLLYAALQEAFKEIEDLKKIMDNLN